MYLTALMGDIGKCSLSIECIVSSIPMMIYVFGPSVYMALCCHFRVIWSLRVLTEVRVREMRCAASKAIHSHSGLLIREKEQTAREASRHSSGSHATRPAIATGTRIGHAAVPNEDPE